MSNPDHGSQKSLEAALQHEICPQVPRSVLLSPVSLQASSSERTKGKAERAAAVLGRLAPLCPSVCTVWGILTALLFGYLLLQMKVMGLSSYSANNSKGETLSCEPLKVRNHTFSMIASSIPSFLPGTKQTSNTFRIVLGSLTSSMVSLYCAGIIGVWLPTVHSRAMS